MGTALKPFYHRNLPHWHPPGRSVFLTWRLDGSLPESVINQLRIIRQQLLKRKSVASAGWTSDRRILEYKKLFAKVDAILDKAETGPLWLKNVAIADLIQETLLRRYTHLYLLWAYVVMANHLHVFLKPKGEGTIGSITKHIKGYTAREANRILNRTGQTFWQQESFDHWARDRNEFLRIVRYIENNPVKAGLARSPEDWTWSSAAERKRRGLTEIQTLT
jgi:REP element-mobilizing transposase RayT